MSWAQGLAVEVADGRVLRVSDDLVPDELWGRVAPLLPPRLPRRRRYPGRLPVDDRAALRDWTEQASGPACTRFF
jgi:hypothetical protein